MIALTRFNRLTLIAALCALSACSAFNSELVDNSAKLADLQPVRMPEVSPVVADVELATVQQRYYQALEVAEEITVRRSIHERLAELAMLRAEQKLLDGVEDPTPYFKEVIAQYQQLISFPMDEHYDVGRREEAIYQLARAYALIGEMELSNDQLGQLTTQHPDASFVIEAQFRRGEAAFSRADYVGAAAAYDVVMTQGRNSPYFLNASYMHGWSMFKRGWYPQAISSFTGVIDRLLTPGTEPESLGASSRNLLEDSLRIISVTFSYLDGPETLEKTYARIGKRHYHHLLYEGLGQLYLEKERFRDSADTYGHYVANNPIDQYSPAFSVLQIEVYGKGNFPSLILPAKQQYVINYGVNSNYWQSLTDLQRQPIRAHLYTYLDELASYEHASAQQAQRDLIKFGRAKTGPKLLAELTEKRQQHYLAAARWYREFIDTFPMDEKTSQMAFLMGEALFEAKDLAGAYHAFEDVAYRYQDRIRGADAGYSAILAATGLLDSEQLSADQHNLWATLKTESALRYASHYAHDKRAVGVLTQAASELLAQGSTADAIDAATRVTQWQPTANSELRKTAWLVLGQSYYDIQQYPQAETAYQQVLTLLPVNDPARADITSRVAASVYRWAEQSLAAGDMAAAVVQLARIQTISPDSEIAITAQFDAANYLITLARWSEAQEMLLNFRRRYPSNSLTKNIAPKLISIYENQQDWQAAATELIAWSKINPDAMTRQQSQYLAGEYFVRAGNEAAAINTFRDYAHQYSQPFAQVMEARYQLSELYRQQNNTNSRDFWLRELIDGDKNAGSDRSDRSIYLAAFATSVRAEQSYASFAKISLKLPLKKSLASKKKALKTTLAMYKSLLEYGVAEYTTLANHRIGAIYAQLSRDLLASQRPKGLDELELEQYEILLEEQAFPFEEQAIELFEANAQRSWTGTYDDWVKHSFSELEKLLPARYRKAETVLEYSNALR